MVPFIWKRWHGWVIWNGPLYVYTKANEGEQPARRRNQFAASRAPPASYGTPVPKLVPLCRGGVLGLPKKPPNSIIVVEVEKKDSQKRKKCRCVSVFIAGKPVRSPARGRCNCSRFGSFLWGKRNEHRKKKRPFSCAVVVPMAVLGNDDDNPPGSCAQIPESRPTHSSPQIARCV